MKVFSKLLIGASLFAASTASAQAVEFMDAYDMAAVTLKVEGIGTNDTTYSMTSVNPDLLEYVDGSLSCDGGLASPGWCTFDMILKTDNPSVPFGYYPEIGFTTPYGYVTITNPVAAIDVALNSGPISLGDVLSTSSTSPQTTPGSYIPVTSPDAQSLASVRPGYDGQAGKLINARFKWVPIAGESTIYQNFQILAAGQELSSCRAFCSDELHVYNDGALGANYFEATANKGQVSVHDAGTVLAWYLTHWNVSGGHYADLRLYTNGTSRYDQGLDLNDYNTLELTLQCTNTMVIETFLGTGDDSSQNFLTDINCGTQTQSYTFNISGFNNLQDIQTALWFHIPTWKNGGLNEYSLFINIHEAIFKK